MMDLLEVLDSQFPTSPAWQGALQKMYQFSMGYFQVVDGMMEGVDTKPDNPNYSEEEAK